MLFAFVAQIQGKNPMQTVNAVISAQPVSAEAAPTQPQFGRTKHENQNSICKNAHTKAHYTGELVSSEEVRHYASKFWSGNDLEIAVALTVPEGQRDLYCIGDETPEYYGDPTNDGRHYGYSVGLYQWRTIIEQTNKGGCEDANWQLGHIDRQTECAFQKWNAKFPSGKPRHWTPWSAFTSGRYKQALGK